MQNQTIFLEGGFHAYDEKSSGYGDRTGSVCLSAGRLRQHGGIPGVFCCKHCGFTNDLATLTFDGGTSTISGTDKDGNELFSHTYHYIGMEPVRGLYEFESDDADSGEFTYFFLAPDTSAETYHIEFRYGSDADALSQYDAGDYAYWLASGISTDCDQTMIDNCIELFCTENLAG